MKVPIYENQVPIKSAPVGGPLSPTPEAPRVIEAAYGGEVGQAISRFGGETVDLSVKLLAHANARKKQRDEDIGDDLANKYDDELTSTLYETKEQVNPQTGEKTRFGGWMNRQNYDANGSYKELAKYAEWRKNSDLEQIKNNPDALRKYMDRVAVIDRSHHNTVLSHEAAEMRNGHRQTFLQSVNSQTNKIMAMPDEERTSQLQTLQDNISKSDLSWSEQQNTMDQVYDQLFSADARTLPFDVMTERLNSGVYKWSKEKDRDTALSSLEHLVNLRNKQAETEKGIGRIGVMKSYFEAITKGEDGLPYIRMASSKDSVLAQVLTKLEKSKQVGRVRPSNEDHKAYQKAAIEMLASNKTPKEKFEYLQSEAKTLMGNDPEDIAILLDATMRGTMAEVSKDPKENTFKTEFKALISHIDEYGLASTNVLSSFFKSMIGGKQPVEAAEEAKAVGAKLKNPEGQKYRLGQVIKNGAGESLEVMGFDGAGRPFGRRIGGKAKSSTK